MTKLDLGYQASTQKASSEDCLYSFTTTTLSVFMHTDYLYPLPSKFFLT